MQKPTETDDMRRLGLAYFAVRLKADHMGYWFIAAKTAEQALAKAMARCRGNGCSTLHLADFETF